MDLTEILKTVAPWISTAIAGPLGGMAIGWACDALGVPDKTQEGLKQALSGVTPEQMLALKNTDQDFAVKMQELGFKQISDLEAIAAGDRDSARKREMSLKDDTPKKLAYSIIGGFIGISILQFFALFFWPEKASSIPQSGWLLIGNVSGYLAAEAKQAAAYYFGTTSDSGRKTELLAQAPAVPK